MRDTIDMAREVKMPYDFVTGEPIYIEKLKAFEALVRADEREEANRSANASWTLMCEKMVAAEREACAKVCEAEPRVWDTNAPDPQRRIAAAIRNRGNT